MTTKRHPEHIFADVPPHVWGHARFVLSPTADVSDEAASFEARVMPAEAGATIPTDLRFRILPSELAMTKRWLVARGQVYVDATTPSDK